VAFFKFLFLSAVFKVLRICNSSVCFSHFSSILEVFTLWRSSNSKPDLVKSFWVKLKIHPHIFFKIGKWDHFLLSGKGLYF
jgi:hypothetical protein